MSFRYPFVVSMASVDGAGVLFYPELFRYAHDAYEAMMDAIGFPLSGILTAGQWRLPIVHAEADMTHPLSQGAHLVVEVGVASLSARAFRVGYAFMGIDSCAHARAMTVHVAVDPNTGRAIPIPRGLRAALDPLCHSD